MGFNYFVHLAIHRTISRFSRNHKNACASMSTSKPAYSIVLPSYLFLNSILTKPSVMKQFATSCCVVMFLLLSNSIYSQRTYETILIDAHIPDALILKEELSVQYKGEKTVYLVTDWNQWKENFDPTWFAHIVHLISLSKDQSLELMDEDNPLQDLETLFANIPADHFYIYGSSLAASQDAKLLFNNFKEATGKNFSASEDVSGPESEKGNWNLEFTTSEMVVPSLDLSNYNHPLGLK